MSPSPLHITYIDGPTALLELGGTRFLTDPTFDPAGTAYPAAGYTLRKTLSPALATGALPPLTGVLLSHDHHADNLDHLGRAFLVKTPAVYTTRVAAERLSGNAVGLEPWEAVTCETPGGPAWRITATPARHGPAGGDRGPVVGFVLQSIGGGPALYLSGDTVWYDGVAEVGRRFSPAIAVLNMGAARVSVAGPAPLTFTAADAVLLARAWPSARIVPLHYEGWEHFSEDRGKIEAAFQDAGLARRLQWLRPGIRTELPLGD